MAKAGADGLQTRRDNTGDLIQAVTRLHRQLPGLNGAPLSVCVEHKLVETRLDDERKHRGGSVPSHARAASIPGEVKRQNTTIGRHRDLRDCNCTLKIQSRPAHQQDQQDLVDRQGLAALVPPLALAC